MQVTIEAPFTVIPEKREYIENKVKDLNTKYSIGITQGNVFFKLDEGKTPNNVLAEIRLRIPGNDLFVGQADKDDVKAFASAYDSIKRLAKREKDKRNEHQSPVKKMTDIVYNTFENNVKAL